MIKVDDHIQNEQQQQYIHTYHTTLPIKKKKLTIFLMQKKKEMY